ncbi:hypothetical protein RNP25_21685, partial [Escherichia coli]|nr:hypothetical protein [Escherichia coli]
MIDSSLALFISSRIHLPYKRGVCTTMVHYPIRLKAHHFVEIVSKQTKKCISPFDITGNDSNLLIVFYVQIMPDDFVMQLHR